MKQETFVQVRSKIPTREKTRNSFPTSPNLIMAREKEGNIPERKGAKTRFLEGGNADTIKELTYFKKSIFNIFARFRYFRSGTRVSRDRPSSHLFTECTDNVTMAILNPRTDIDEADRSSSSAGHRVTDPVMVKAGVLCTCNRKMCNGYSKEDLGLAESRGYGGGEEEDKEHDDYYEDESHDEEDHGGAGGRYFSMSVFAFCISVASKAASRFYFSRI